LSETAANPPSPETPAAPTADATSSPSADSVAPLATPTDPPALTVSLVPPSAPTASLATAPETMKRYKRVRGHLAGISVETYRAFRGPFQLNLPRGENALIYGENGAGKSSLFHSVRDFLEAPQSEFLERDKPEAEGKRRELRLADNQHRPKTGEPKIELEFEHGKFTWDAPEDASRKSGPWNAIVTATNKAKGFLDYRALLRIHFLPSQDGGRIDVFDLIIRQSNHDFLSSIHAWLSGLRRFLKLFFAPPGGTRVNRSQRELTGPQTRTRTLVLPFSRCPFFSVSA
jgi:energy-coupling factor transporter ATP-binding protein EcfA2